MPGGGRDLVISVNALTVNRAQCWTLQVTQEGIRDRPCPQGVFSLLLLSVKISNAYFKGAVKPTENYRQNPVGSRWRIYICIKE